MIWLILGPVIVVGWTVLAFAVAATLGMSVRIADRAARRDMAAARRDVAAARRRARRAGRTP